MSAAPAPDDESVVRAEVMRLHYMEGLSVRAIARRLHRSRRTVRQHLGRLPPRADKESGRRPSLLDPHEDLILGWLAESPELRAPQILDRLRSRGFSGGITTVRDRIRRLRPQLAAPIKDPATAAAAEEHYLRSTTLWHGSGLLLRRHAKLRGGRHAVSGGDDSDEMRRRCGLPHGRCVLWAARSVPVPAALRHDRLAGVQE